jgi:uridylate kinase
MKKRAPHVVLKLSGEVLAGSSAGGIDRQILSETAAELTQAQKEGARAAVVLGGGNIFRGLGAAAKGMDRAAADQMGMLATVINGLALTDAVKKAGGRVELFTAFAVGSIGAFYSPASAREAVDDGVLAVLTGGTGNPFFSTDTAAALRAAELGCGLLLKGTKVDGVYDKDPEIHKDAKRFDEITVDEMLERRLGVIDLTAAVMCRENNIDIRVYRMTDSEVVYRAALGEPLGTLVRAKA